MFCSFKGKGLITSSDTIVVLGQCCGFSTVQKPLLCQQSWPSCNKLIRLWNLCFNNQHELNTVGFLSETRYNLTTHLSTWGTHPAVMVMMMICMSNSFRARENEREREGEATQLRTICCVVIMDKKGKECESRGHCSRFLRKNHYQFMNCWAKICLNQSLTNFFLCFVELLLVCLSDCLRRRVMSISQ